MDRQTELLNRHQDLLQRERVFHELLRRLGATSISTSVRVTSANVFATPPFDHPLSQIDLLERERVLQRMQKQLITTMSTSLRATVAHHHANSNIPSPLVSTMNSVYPNQRQSLAILYEAASLPLPDALDAILVECWGTQRNLDATIAGVSKAWNRCFWEGRLAKSHEFSIVCDEDEERTSTGPYTLLRRHPDVSTLFVRKWDALLVLSEALNMAPTNGNCGAFITTLDMRNFPWETVTSWSLACPLLAVCLMDNRLPSLEVLKIGEETTHPYFSPVPVQSILSALLPDVSIGLCELHFTSRLQQDNWRTLAAVLEARHRSSCCRGLRVLEHDWYASIDGDSLARILQVGWVTLERLGSPNNPWTTKAAVMVGDAVHGLEAACL